MACHNIKKFLAVTLLTAYVMSSALSAIAIDASTSYTSSMVISSNAQLTERNNLITLSLRDSDVKQVLRMFADKVGMNIVFHSSVEGKVTLDLVNMPINEAFDLVLQIANLNYYKQNNTLVIIAKSSADNSSFSKQEMMFFPIKYVSATKIANFLNKNVFGMQKAGMSSINAATVNAATNELIVFGMKSDATIVQKVIEQLDREPLSKTFAVNHTTPAEMADMICNFLLPARGVSSGDSDSSEEGFAPPSPGMGTTGGAAGILTGGAASTSSSGDEIKLGEGVVACTVTQSASGTAIAPFDLQNIAISYYPQRGTISVVGGSESQINMIEKYIKANDVKQPQAYLEVSIVELNEAGSKEFSNQWYVQSKAWGANFNGTSTSGGREGGLYGRYFDGNLIQDNYEYEFDENGNLLKVTPSQDIIPWKFLMPATTYISWQMNYLIENQKARVLANPKLMITNGQESVIDLTQDYVEKVTSEFISSTSAGTGATGTVQRTYTIGKDQGIKVSLTPFISPNGYVTLNIKPDYATPSGTVTTISETGYGTDLQATLLSRRNLDLKNIRIKDGETLVIGGLIQENEQKTVSKIPILGDLPVIGSVFRSTSTSKSKSELIIMLTPKIINDGEDSVAEHL